MKHIIALLFILLFAVPAQAATVIVGNSYTQTFGDDFPDDFACLKLVTVDTGGRESVFSDPSCRPLDSKPTAIRWTWDDPAHRTDGAAITKAEIAGYRAYMNDKEIILPPIPPIEIAPPNPPGNIITVIVTVDVQ